MPSWWGGKSPSKEGNKRSKESIVSTIQRKLRNFEVTSKCSRSTGTQLHHDIGISNKPSLSHLPSKSEEPPPRHMANAQPLPLPLHAVDRAIVPSTTTHVRISEPNLNSPKKHDNLQEEMKPFHYGGDPVVLAESYTDSEDHCDSHLLSPQTYDYEKPPHTPMRSPSRSMIKRNRPFNVTQNVSREVPNLQIPRARVFTSVPDSLNSSPSRSPLRVSGHELYSGTPLWARKPYPDVYMMGSGQCSSPGSAYNSGHNSVGGDLFWQNTRCSPDYSAIPSPIAVSTSSSRVQSSPVSPLHPRTVNRQVDKRQRSHRLPLPPITVSRSCTFSPSYSEATSPSPSVPRSPVRAESFGSPWKKGRVIGRGTFGNVYLAFNSESGEMCAMKEVTLFYDDPKSKECAQQLVQELSLLGRLHHPNIVQYYGSGMVDYKLYIYLEYVSGGSIHRLIQEYGQFGETAIRNYTHQILSGLAYLHSKNTVHRDIKGANILVDPSGCVKLADFGMAKHTAGHSCPFSFKGSPYWMAPEVIQNSKGCNLAVDIWSLGCTVLEMATTKPPWSQYEGVAAMFKIGKSRDLPPIPHRLSNEGKDFVKRCLQRDPAARPTAAQLLLHPFVCTAALPFERNPISPPESHEILHNTLPTPGAEVGSLDTRKTAGLRTLQLKVTQGPLTCSRSPLTMSPSPMSSPWTPSVTSKEPPMYSNTAENGSFLQESTIVQPFCSERSEEELYRRQAVLSDHASQELLRDSSGLNPPIMPRFLSIGIKNVI